MYHQDDPAERQSWILYLQQSIRHRPSGCVYDADGTPISWHIYHLYGSSGLGNTMPEYKSHRLFMYTSICSTRQLDCEKDGKELFGYNAMNNQAGLTVSQKVGWKKIGVTGHRFYKPVTKLQSKL